MMHQKVFKSKMLLNIGTIIIIYTNYTYIKRFEI